RLDNTDGLVAQVLANLTNDRILMAPRQEWEVGRHLNAVDLLGPRFIYPAEGIQPEQEVVLAGRPNRLSVDFAFGATLTQLHAIAQVGFVFFRNLGVEIGHPWPPALPY